MKPPRHKGAAPSLSPLGLLKSIVCAGRAMDGRIPCFQIDAILGWVRGPNLKEIKGFVLKVHWADVSLVFCFVRKSTKENHLIGFGRLPLYISMCDPSAI